MESWVLNTIQGFALEFTYPPLQSGPPHPPVSDRTSMVLIDLELNSLLTKGAIEPASFPLLFVSNSFLVHKRLGAFRSVINLHPLNAFIIYCHFKIEGIHLLRDLLLKVDWFTRLKLKDAFPLVHNFPSHSSCSSPLCDPLTHCPPLAVPAVVSGSPRACMQGSSPPSQLTLTSPGCSGSVSSPDQPGSPIPSGLQISGCPTAPQVYRSRLPCCSGRHEHQLHGEVILTPGAAGLVGAWLNNLIPLQPLCP